MTTLYCPRKFVGIVSWGPWDCEHPDYPAGYTMVSAVRDWLIHLCSAQIIPKGITRAVAIPEAGNLYLVVCKCRRQIKSKSHVQSCHIF